MKKIIITIIFLLLISAAITASVVMYRPQPNTDATKNTDDLIFYTLDGEALTYKEAISPSKTILFLWTSGCDICKDTMIHLGRECSMHDDINVLYLNIADPKALIKSFFSHYKIAGCITENTLLDTQTNIRSKFFILGVPTVIFFKDGVPVEITYTLNNYLIKKIFGDG